MIIVHKRGTRPRRDIVELEKARRTFIKTVFYRAPQNDRILSAYKALGMRILRFNRAAANLALCFRTLRKEVKLPASKLWVFRRCNTRTGGFNLHYNILITIVSAIC